MDGQSKNSIRVGQNRVHPESEAANMSIGEVTGMDLNQQIELPTNQDCRICIESSDNLIRPCRCTGSAAYVHFECLKTWISKRSADKDGIVRQLQRVNCEMCKYMFRCNTKTKKTFNCEEYSRTDTCRGDVIMQVFFMAFFFFGTIVIAGLLGTRLEQDIADYKNGYPFSVTSVCLIVSMPLSAIIGIVLAASFTRKHCYRQQRIIVNIDEYDGTEKRLASNNNLVVRDQSL